MIPTSDIWFKEAFGKKPSFYFVIDKQLRQILIAQKAKQYFEKKGFNIIGLSYNLEPQRAIPILISQREDKAGIKFSASKHGHFIEPINSGNYYEQLAKRFSVSYWDYISSTINLRPILLDTSIDYRLQKLIAAEQALQDTPSRFIWNYIHDKNMNIDTLITKITENSYKFEKSNKLANNFSMNTNFAWAKVGHNPLLYLEEIKNLKINIKNFLMLWNKQLWNFKMQNAQKITLDNVSVNNTVDFLEFAIYQLTSELSLDELKAIAGS